MLATGGVILTSAGALMISRSLELVKPIEFTHMKIGTGDISSLDNARALTDLVASYMTINMSSIARNENTIRIRGSFTNESFSNEVTIKEIGVFAKIGAEQSVLFGYVNDGQGEVIPPGNSGNVISRTRDLYIGVTSEAEAVITIDKSLVYPTIEDLEEGLNQKENKFNKNSGFNKTKSDATNLKDSETLATSMAVAKTMEKAEEALNSAGGKEPAFNKNTAFNKNFGVAQNEVLEGSKLAEIYGIEPGGNLNNTNLKVAGKAYYCTANKKTYKCIANTSINYADAAYFEEISNNDLLGKLQNLFIGYSRYKYKKISIRVTPVINPNFSTIAVYNCGIVRLSEYLEGGDIISALIYDTEAELCSINKYNNDSVTIEYIRNSSSATPVSNFNIDLIIGFN
ncbi:hypothetical protein VSU16_03545 [Cetobacterium somerae]|uniref:hypothetical protein n=1 Tax=Cetobacterium somerae TaxID=188913 RepID=UPI002E7B65C7|nr:hypothetical protein [Cetobacterium somerae]WVJ01816.1 hypothetical protein VSU16_03545 [Cetobacterium somerae]